MVRGDLSTELVFIYYPTKLMENIEQCGPGLHILHVSKVSSGIILYANSSVIPGHGLCVYWLYTHIYFYANGALDSFLIRAELIKVFLVMFFDTYPIFK
ncbi:hypothetical protein FKM82_012426 [Ascaphus truei]